MPLALDNGEIRHWQVNKIGVIGPGIVGMPMAALLASARIREGADQPATVTVIQRRSATSGWKVDAINAGQSPIGGVEPELDRIVGEAVSAGLLNATDDFGALRDADVVLVCVQTDKTGFAPDYGPMFEALHPLAQALRRKPAQNIPLIIFESTLAPSSMATVVREHFRQYGLEEGRDLLLGNSPNRVMPGRLVERVASSDKIVAGLRPLTPRLIARLYGRIVTGGALHQTNSLTAEVVKTLENAFRDVRIAFAAEIARFCDAENLDFYAVRQEVNARLAQSDTASSDPTVVPSGGILVPTLGVGGHCLPKDGILLWWRRLERGAPTESSLILEARCINDESPAATVALAERFFGRLAGKSVALLGTAYRFNSEDTRNSPTLALARQLQALGCEVVLHDPYVRPSDQNLLKSGLKDRFTRDLGVAVDAAEYIFLCTAHRDYTNGLIHDLAGSRRLRGVVDACNLFRTEDFASTSVGYTGIGRGGRAPSAAFIDFVFASFRAMETGVANEVQTLLDFLNEHYADAPFNRADLGEVRRLTATCLTGCAIASPGRVSSAPSYHGFASRLAVRAGGA